MANVDEYFRHDFREIIRSGRVAGRDRIARMANGAFISVDSIRFGVDIFESTLAAGGTGNDLLIGGNGRDSIDGNEGDDLLIGGFTDYDSNDAALRSIVNEWSANRSYQDRLQYLRRGGGLNGSIVLNDTVVHGDRYADRLIGGTGRDWFWNDAATSELGSLGDHILDLTPGEEYENDLGLFLTIPVGGHTL